MDGKGTRADNLFVERLWREVKSGEVFLSGGVGAVEDRREYGNSSRSCTDLASGPRNRTPAEVFQADRAIQEEESRVNKVRTVAGNTGGVTGTLASLTNKACPANRVYLALGRGRILASYHTITPACLSCGCPRW